MKRITGRINSFEAIRVLAILGVVFYHLNPKMTPYGYLGVVTLFVLAGYLSFYQISLKKPKPILDQLIKKWTKLYPPLVMMVSVISLLMIIFFPNFLKTLGSSIRASLLGFNNYQQIFAGESYFQGQLYLKPFTHLWAIALELQFYVLFILGISTFYRQQDSRKWTIILTSLSILSFIIFVYKIINNSDPTPAYYGLESRLFSFLIGMLATIYTPMLRKFKLKNITSIFIFILLIFLFFKNTSNMPIQMLIYTFLVSLLLMVSFYETSFLKKLGHNEIIKYLSSRSYFLYLWHYPIIEMMIRFFANKKINTTVLMILILIISLTITEAFYQLHQRFNKKMGYYALTLILVLVLLLLPYKILYELRADQNFKDLENSLTQEPTQTMPTHPQPAPQPEVDQKDVIQLSPSATKEDFQESFITYFEQLNQYNPNVYYTFEDFIRYRTLPVTLIGDSIAYIAQPHFESYLPNIVISAEKSRLLEEVDQYYFELKEKNQIKDILILSFGTNSVVETDEGLIKIWEDLDGKPMILLDLVMPYPVNEESRNKIIHNFIETHDNVYLASWYEYAKSHAEFFAQDFMHPNDLGSRAFIHLITDKIIEIAKEMETQGKLEVK